MTKRKKSAAKKSAKGKSNAAALELIDGLDSKHESLQPVLRKLAAGEKVADAEIEALDDQDSRVSQVIPILRGIRDGKSVKKELAQLDSFGEGVKPVLEALAGPSKS